METYLRRYLAKPLSCLEILSQLLQRSEATSDEMNFSDSATLYILRTSALEPFAMSKNRANSVFVVLPQPSAILLETDTTPV